MKVWHSVLTLFLVLSAHVARAQVQGDAHTRLRSLGELTPRALDTVCQKKKLTVAGDQCTSDCERRIQEQCSNYNGGPGAASGGVLPTETLPWQATLIAGASQFVADRAKAETIAWLEDVIGKKLCALTYTQPGLTQTNVRWFEQSCHLLKDEQYAAQMSTAILASAIRTDLLRLPRAIVYWWYLQERPSRNVTLSSQQIERLMHDIDAGERLVLGLQNGSAPLEVLAGLGHDPDLRVACLGASDGSGTVSPECALVVAGLFIEHFGDALQAANLTRISIDDFDKILTAVLSSDRLCYELNDVFGVAGGTAVASQQACTLNAKVPAPIARYVKMLNLGEADYQKYRARLLTLANSMVALEAKIRGLKNSEVNATKILDTLNSVNTTADAMFALFDANEQAAEFDRIAGQAKFFVKISGELMSGQYMEAGADLVNANYLANLDIEVPESMKRFLAFVMDAASAKTSDDVALALEHAAAPIGGWKLKHDRFSISVGSFVGGMLGKEKPVLTNSVPGMAASNAEFQGGTAAGLFAPVGVDFAGPICHSGFSAGLFVSVLDLGQLTWSRLEAVSQDSGKTKVDVAPTTDFTQVFSPGAYAHVSLFNSPFILGAGVSFGPALRKYTFDADTMSPQSSSLSVVRVGMFLAVDVTLLPLWAK